MRRVLGLVVLGLAALELALTACWSSPEAGGGDAAVVPTGAGRLEADAVIWALGDRIHVGDQTIRADARVRAMVTAHGRIYLAQGRSGTVVVTDGDELRPTGLHAGQLAASADGRYLGLLDTSDGTPWSIVVVDLESGEEVVRDATGMGGPDDDLADLYEDVQPAVLGFQGHELFVRTATSSVMSWAAESGEHTDHGHLFYVAGPDAGGGQALPGLVHQGRLVVPKDPYRSTQPGHVSPDGSVALMPVDGRTQVYDVASGRRLPADLGGRHFVLGAWTSPGTAYGAAFDGSAFGPHRVRIVTCELTVEVRDCRVLRTVRPPAHQLVLFPTGSPATDH